MYPNLYVFGGVPFSLHDALVGLGMLAGGAVLLVEAKRRDLMGDHWWWIVFASLMGAVIGARLGPMLQHWDLSQNASFQEQWIEGNRSILGGLAGAYGGVLIAKRITGWRVVTGDAFAPAVALGMAIGRVGCLLTEVPGTPTGGGWGVTLSGEAAARLGGVQAGVEAGVPLHPSFAYEIAFHLIAFVWLWAVRTRPYPPGLLFRWYIVAYAAFRFAVEFVRGNDAVWWGLSRAQWFLLVAVVLGVVVRLAVRAWRERHARPQDPVASEPAPLGWAND